MKKPRTPFILVVVGDSASGKTTLLGNLTRVHRLKPWVSVRDMDEDGCPYPGREHWRKFRVEQLLAESVGDYENGRGAIMGGWIWPHEVIASPYFRLDLNLHFLFLDNIEKEYIRRLKTRIGTRMIKREFNEWLAGFAVRKQQLLNQVKFTVRHSVIDTWKFSRKGVVTEALKTIDAIAQN